MQAISHMCVSDLLGKALQIFLHGQVNWIWN